MATLVFDIETTAQPLENFDAAQQEYLFRETEKIADEVGKSAKREEITRFMSLWPFTSQVVCIAMLNPETLRGQSIYVADDFEDEATPAAPKQSEGRRGKLSIGEFTKVKIIGHTDYDLIAEPIWFASLTSVALKRLFWHGDDDCKCDGKRFL